MGDIAYFIPDIVEANEGTLQNDNEALVVKI